MILHSYISNYKYYCLSILFGTSFRLPLKTLCFGVLGIDLQCRGRISTGLLAITTFEEDLSK
jgi:hypothetical protein